MATILHSVGSDLIVGLQWSRVLPGETEFGKSLDLGRRIKAKYKARFVSDGVTAIAVAPKPSGRQAKKNTAFLSVAVLFTKHIAKQQHAVLLLPISDNRQWLIVVLDGIPYLEYECDVEHVVERIDALQIETQVEFAIYGESKALAVASPLSLDELASTSGTGASVTAFTDTRSIKTMATVGIVIAAIMGANEANKIRLQNIEEEQERVLAIDPINAYTESLNRILTKAGFPGTAALEAYWNPIANREIVQANWQSKAMLFKGGASVVSWERLSGGSESQLKDALDDDPRLVPNGRLVDTVHKVSMKRAILRRMELPENGKYLGRLKMLQEDMEHSGIRMTFQQPRLAGLPSGLTATQVPPRITVSKGTVAIEGRLGQMVELMNSLDSNIAIDGLAVATPGQLHDARFGIKGTYYVKN